MELRVNDYVRTKYGIAKIINLKENPYGEKTIYVIDNAIINIEDLDGDELFACNPFIDELQDRFDTNFGDEKCITKSSPNIINLIEVGDYVNGNVVKELNDELVIMNTGLIYDNNLYLSIKQIDIKSIVTKQQFEAMQYKVGE